MVIFSYTMELTLFWLCLAAFLQLVLSKKEELILRSTVKIM